MGRSTGHRIIICCCVVVYLGLFGDHHRRLLCRGQVSGSCINGNTAAKGCFILRNGDIAKAYGLSFCLERIDTAAFSCGERIS